MMAGFAQNTDSRLEQRSPEHDSAKEPVQPEQAKTYAFADPVRGYLAG
jgi:hypothetical protein